MSKRIYKKAGRTIRAELSRGSLAYLEIDEHGIAVEDGPAFRCEPGKTGLGVEPPDRKQVEQMADTLRELPTERFTILSGNAVHEFEEHQWKESFGRVHISITHHHQRVLLDLGTEALSRIDLAPARQIASALDGLRPSRPCTATVLLHQHVVASLLTVLIERAGDRIVQSAHPHFRFDGDGREIQPVEWNSRRGWPNRFRPSYRTRPVPMPFHLRGRWPTGTVQPEIEVMALIEPFHIDHEMISGRLLCLRENESFPAAILLPANDLMARLRSVGAEETWFPYGAGSYGTEVSVEELALRAGSD